MRRFVEPHTRRQAPSGDRSKIAFGERAHLGRIDIARDDQDGVVGRVPFAIGSQRVVGAEAGGFHCPSRSSDCGRDDAGTAWRAAVRASNAAGSLSMRIRRSSRTTSRSGSTTLSSSTQPGHAVGFEPHDQFQPVARDGLVKGGIVLGGECVVAPAVACDQRGKAARRNGGRALEHQMFEEMGDAGFPERIVGGPDLVPDHLHDRRDAMVRHDHNLHAVAEREALGPEALRRGGRSRTQTSARRQKKTQDHFPLAAALQRREWGSRPTTLKPLTKPKPLPFPPLASPHESEIGGRIIRVARSGHIQLVTREKASQFRIGMRVVGWDDLKSKLPSPYKGYGEVVEVASERQRGRSQETRSLYKDHEHGDAAHHAATLRRAG